MQDTDESTIEDLLRRALRRTYRPAALESIDYVDATYEQFDRGSHLLRARAPDHELLGFERWAVVEIEGRAVHFRGAGRAGPNEFFVRVRLEPE